MRWQTATITDIVKRSKTVSSFFFQLPEFVPFVAGQHVIVRLTAPDGYRAQRSYSIASAPETTDAIELAIEKLEDGEVSPFFHDVAAVGDAIELSTPIGGHFVWNAADGGPVLLIGGGSGVVPFLSMIRHRAAQGSTAAMRLLFSARTADDVLFADELARLGQRHDGFDVAVTLTRQAAPPQGMLKGRVDRAMIAAQLAAMPGTPRRIYICGSNAFVENAAQHAIDAGMEPSTISTERYGL